MNVLDVNLNLLVGFEALMAERNVTRAAARIGLTQPAMSNVLAQLRTIFGDPLLVRGPGGMVPTVRALALEEPLRQGLGMLDDALRAQMPFDPASARREFVIGASDFVEMVVLPPLLRRLSVEAPGVDLMVQHWTEHQPPEDLARGRMDLALGIFEQSPAGHHRQHLFRDRFVVVLRKNNPLAKGRLTLSRYLKLTHILVTAQEDGLGAVDAALARRGLKRRIGLRLPHHLMVPHIVAQTDLAVALSSRIAEPFSRLMPLRLLKLPLDLRDGFMSQTWHERTHHDPAVVWLRGVIAQISEAL